MGFVGLERCGGDVPDEMGVDTEASEEEVIFYAETQGPLWSVCIVMC